MQVSGKTQKAGANFSNKDLPFSVLVREKTLDNPGDIRTVEKYGSDTVVAKPRTVSVSTQKIPIEILN